MADKSNELIKKSKIEFLIMLWNEITVKQSWIWEKTYFEISYYVFYDKMGIYFYNMYQWERKKEKKNNQCERWI